MEHRIRTSRSALLVSVVALALAIPNVAVAQVDRRALSLGEAHELVLSQNLRLQAARAQLEAVSTLARQVRSQWLPQVVLFAQYLRYDHEMTADFASGFDPLVPFFVDLAMATGVMPPAIDEADPLVVQHQDDYNLGGSVAMSFAPSSLFQLEGANLVRDQVEMGVEEVSWRLGMATTDIYYGLVSLQETREVALRNIETRRLSLEIAEARAELGACTELERLQAELALSEARAQLTQLDHAYDQLALRLATLLQIAPVFSVVRPPTPAPSSHIEDLVESAESQRPDMEGARLEIERSEAAIREVRWMWAPNLDASFNLVSRRTTAFNDQDVVWNLTFGLTWPIFLGNVRPAMRDQRDAEAAAARFELEDRRSELTAEIDEAGLQRAALESQLDLAVEQRRLAETALDVARALFDEDLATQLDIAAAETALFAAEVAVVQAEVAIEQQDARIQSLSGVLWTP